MRGQSVSGEGAEREGDTESEAGSRLQALRAEPDTVLELMNHEIMTSAKVRRLTGWATQVPHLPSHHSFMQGSATSSVLGSIYMQI